MRSSPLQLTLIDRVIFLCFGALIGLIYGALIAVATFFTSEIWTPQLISWFTGVFAVLGFISGGFVGEAFLLLIHLLWGLLSGFAMRQPSDDEVESKGYLGAILLVGFGTGLALVLSRRHLFY